MHSATTVKLCSTLMTTLAIAACTYQVSLNEKVVYEPPPLFSEFSIGDQALKTCVKSEIREQEIKSADALLAISCPAGKIKALDGLEVFIKLESLGLADNQIKDITALEKLTQLRRLNLRNNDVEETSALVALLQLEYIDLRSNSALNCSSLEQELLNNKSKVELLCDN